MSRDAAIKELVKSQNLLTILIEDINKLVGSMADLRDKPNLHDIFPARSSYTYGENLSKRLDFLSYVLSNCV